MNLRVTVLAVATVVNLSSQFARAACGYDEPVMQRSMQDLGVDPAAFSPQGHSLTGTTSLVCTINGTPPNPPGSQDNWSIFQTMVYANATDFEVQWVRGNKTCTTSPDDGKGLTGSKVCPYDDVTGTHAVLKVQGTCNGQCGYHLGPYVYSDEITFAPGIEELTRNHVELRERPAGLPGLIGAITIDTIPVGYPFALTGARAYPATGDVFTIHVEGAGINFSHVYGPNLRSDGKPQDVGSLWYQDTATSVTATQPGEIRFWAELNGVKSVVRTLHAVQWTNGYPPGSGPSTGNPGTGGGSGSGSGSGDEPSGCNTTGLSLLALVPLLFRRKLR